MLRSRIVGAAARRAKAVLPDLPYEYHALEPYISADIMELHHSKHHATYVNNLNIANENLSEAANAGDVSKCIQLANVIKFNGGGHINHSIFWQVRRKPDRQILVFSNLIGQVITRARTLEGATNQNAALFKASNQNTVFFLNALF